MFEQSQLSPETIANTQIIYNIPIYQRLFEWNDEKINNLLDDLLASYKKNETAPYYIGMLTAYGQDTKQDLVDGQQRFTVSTLIGIVFNQYYEDWIKFLTVDDKPRLHFSAREEDYEFLKKLIFDVKFLSDLLTEKKHDNYINERMLEGIKTINSWQQLNFYNNRNQRAMFAKYVFKQMSFFITKLPKGYKAKDLNRYFESMNSLGRNLESYEILEVDCLKMLPLSCDLTLYTKIWNLVSDMDTPLVRKINHKDKSKRESEEEYNTRFKSLIDLCIKNSVLDSIAKQLKRDGKKGLNDLGDSNEFENITIGETKADQTSKPSPHFHEGSHHSMLNFTEFLLQVLYIHNGYVNGNGEVTVNDFFDIHKLSETFDTHIMKVWKNDAEDCRRFFMNLLKYRLIYDYYIIRIANNDGEDYELELSSDDENSSKDIEVLKKFQSMFYAGSASKTFYRWVTRVLAEVNKKENNISPIDLYQYLLHIDAEIRESEGIQMPLTSNVLRYDNNVPLYWFRRLDFILWKKIVIDDDFESTLPINKDVVASLKFRRGGRSIEHLHPRNQDYNQKWNEDNIDEFGNLALVTGSFNSEQSNDNLDVKFGRIKQQVDSYQLQSIKMYLMYLEADSDGAKWTDKIMFKHQEHMIAILNSNVNVLSPATEN